jgi:hypothetical protein
MYGVPTMPAGGDEIVNVAVAGSIVIETGPVAERGVPSESVAVIVTVDVPDAVGVPDKEQLA